MRTRDPSRDTPAEAAIQDLIADRKFEEAFTRSYLAYGEAIATYCINVLRGDVSDPRADGEEITQQVFIEFWSALPTRYNSTLASVRTFLFSNARRRAIDKLRTPHRSIPGRDAELQELDREDLIESHLSNPEFMSLDQEKAEILNHELSMLPALDREIIKLYYWFNHSTAEIAEITGKKEGNIRVRLKRARDKIGEKLREVFNGDQ